MTTTAAAPAPPESRQGANYWRDALAPYARPDLRRSALDLATSVAPYLALSVAMYFSLSLSYWVTLALAVPAAGFLLRTFIVFHDCSHGSFMPTKRANAIVGSICGLLVYSPFESWRHEHAVHHATAGDLDRRGMGDVETLTVAEYVALPWWKRLGYRLFRNPLVMFGLGPIWALMLEPRLVPGWARSRHRRAILVTDAIVAVLVGGLCWLIGWHAYLLVQMPTAMMAGAAGVWLFYVQHQFEGVYWKRSDDWSYADAALRGSSYLRLPKVLQFFTGNIGLHHVHHLSARIPNYNLQRAHDDNALFHEVPVLTLWSGLKTIRLKLWDERSGRLVTFREAWASARASGG